jgi:hypothetical protein
MNKPNNKSAEIDLKETPRLYIQTSQGEISIHMTASGELRLSTDGSFVILPNGSNAFNIEIRN